MSYSHKKFMEDIERLERWLERRRKVLSGQATARRIWVEKVTIKKHTRGGHYRTVIRMNPKPRKKRR